MSPAVEVEPLPLALIAAMAANGVIGRDNALPWELPEDLRDFRAKTLGKPVIMGRHTHESIGRPLPGRSNVVVSRSWAEAPPGVLLAPTPEAALDMAQAEGRRLGAEEVMLIGGGQLYRWGLPRAQRLYLTLIDVEVEGDARFPDWSENDWRECSREDGVSEAGLAFSWRIYQRDDLA